MRKRSTAPLLALCLAMLGAGGCKKASYGDSSSYAGEAYPAESSVELTSAFGYDPLQSGAVGGSATSAPAEAEPMADDYDMVEEESMRTYASVESDAGGGGMRGLFDRAGDRRQARREAKMDAEAGNSVTSPGAGGNEGGGDSPPPEVALEKPEDPGKVATGKDEKDPEDEVEDHGRQIIYTAAMVVAVYDVDEATELAETLPKKFGGFVQQRRRGVLIIKIPAAKLQKAMEELATFGIVQARQLQAQDVTAEYTDLESRIRVLRDTQAQLLELLKQAKNVEETLRVRQALDQVTMELEVALGRMRQLSEAISFSTLTVQFSERRPQHHLPSSNDPFRWVDQLGVEGTEWR